MLSEAEKLCAAVAADHEAISFLTDPDYPVSRGPYLSGEPMCRGAAYFPKFQEFILRGGVAKFKTAVVVSIRVNSFHSLDEMAGHFTVNYFLDLAFWAPEYAEAFYKDQETVGQHALFEPKLMFPETLSHKYLSRSAEFSQSPKSRNHGKERERERRCHYTHVP